MQRSVCRVFLGSVVAVMLVAPALGDKIYRTTNDQGEVIYTNDPPSDDSKPVDLDPLTTVPSTDTDKKTNESDAPGKNSDEKTPANGLSGIHLKYPPADKGVRHNGGNLPVRIGLEPEEATIPRGHHVEIVIDGDARGRGTGQEVIVSGLDRGPHRVQARITDRAGETRYETDTVKFYLLRASVGN